MRVFGEDKEYALVFVLPSKLGDGLILGTSTGRPDKAATTVRARVALSNSGSRVQRANSPARIR